MKQYTGIYKGMKFTVTPTHNRTQDNEVKCCIDWGPDQGSDYIWFDDTGTNLICQLNNKIFVVTEGA